MKRKLQSDGYYRHTEMYNGVQIDIRSKDAKTLDEKVRQRKNDIDNGVTTGADVTLSEWADIWLETTKKDSCAKRTYEMYRGIIKNYIVPYLGKYKLRDIAPIDVQRMINKSCAGRTAATVSFVKTSINSMMKLAVVNRRIMYNPVSSVTLPSAPSGTHRAFTDDEIETILEAAKTHYAGMFVKMLLYCGLRPQECAPLLWRDIDMDNATVNVNKAYKASGELGTTKTPSGNRTIPIPAIYMQELRDYRNSIDNCNDDDNIFLTINSRKISRNNLFLIWRSFCAHAELTGDNRIYNLRHTYCTNLMRAGVPLKTAMYLMGHSDVHMVARIYGHYTRDQGEIAREQIDNFINHGSDNGS